MVAIPSSFAGEQQWCGDPTEVRKIAALAHTYNKPLAPHDCTGPVALLAGAHLGLHARAAVWQEVVRASLAWYGERVSQLPVIRQGFAEAPTAPGPGTALRAEVKRRSDAVVRQTR